MNDKEEMRDLVGRPIKPKCPPQEGLWGQAVRGARLEETAETTTGLDENSGSLDRETGYLFDPSYTNRKQANINYQNPI